MLLGLLFLGLVPAAFMAEGFMNSADEVEPDEKTSTSDNGDFISAGDDAGEDDARQDDVDTTIEEDSAEEVIGEEITPIDEPGEGLPSATDATLLDGLLAENCDAIYGLHEYDVVMKDPDPMVLTDEADEFTGSSDGVKSDGALDLFQGTPFVELESQGLVGVIDAQDGDDTITTGDDASFAFGGEGDDHITVGAAPAAIFGGEGNDTIIGAYTADDGEYSGYLDGGIGDDSIEGGEGVDLIFGGQHDETGEGSDNDTLSGGAGNDQISGGDGADEISGDEGDDILNHMGHAMESSGAERSSFDWHIDNDQDVLNGGAGNDTLIFDRADIAIGGEGVDNFHLYFDHEAGEGHAEVTDFVSGEDFLRVTLNPDVDPDNVELDVSPSEDGNDGVVSVNGEVVAVLEGAPDATTADIYVEVMQEIYA